MLGSVQMMDVIHCRTRDSKLSGMHYAGLFGQDSWNSMLATGLTYDSGCLMSTMLLIASATIMVIFKRTHSDCL